MIITVDPTQSEDIAAFAMVKQYRLQALNVTLNGGTGSGAWQAVQGGEGYTQTVVTAVTGIELVYEDPNAIVSYTVENDDTSNYDTASEAGIILSSIEPTDNDWTYTCVFYADSVPVSSVDIDLLVYGNVARGTEQQGSSATAEEITAQVLAGLETRVSALETALPTKVSKLTTAGDYAYTHNGSTDGEIAIVGGTTAATIPIRDANGRMQSANPASGATDTTLVTANWISQTGDSAPNNAVHRNGDETVNGTKKMENIINVNSLENRCVTAYGYGTTSAECWWKFYEKTNTSWHKGSFIHIYDLNNHEYSIFYISGFGTGASGQAAYKLMGSFSATRVRVARKDSLVSIFIQTTSATNRPYAWISFDLNGVTSVPHANTPVFLAVTPTVSTEPTVGEDYDAVITPTVIQ